MQNFVLFAFGFLALTCMHPLISPELGLSGGVLWALLLGRWTPKRTKILSKNFLAFSVIGLGAGLNIRDCLEIGALGFGFSLFSVLFTLCLGLCLGCLLGVQNKLSQLLSFGTAICGGSAIAALAPITKAREEEISIALATIFILNAIALWVFPIIGRELELSQYQFGWWAALAIHDTSSVVGAAIKYGPEAASTATSIKLARALWIIPLVLIYSFYSRHNLGLVLERSPTNHLKDPPEGQSQIFITGGKLKRYIKTTLPPLPYFIFGFVVVSALNSFVPTLTPLMPHINFAAHRLMVVTLFLIGAGLSTSILSTIGLKPFLQALILWIVITSMALWGVVLFVK